MLGIRKKNIELLSASRRMDEKRREALHKMIYLAAGPAILSCIILCATCTYKAKTMHYKSETEKIMAFLEDEETRNRSQRIELLQEKISMFQEFRENSELAREYMASLISVKKRDMDLIIDNVLEGIEVQQVSFNNDNIILLGSADDYKQISAYINKLEETEAFNQILYNGFTRNSAGRYEFRITCCLS